MPNQHRSGGQNKPRRRGIRLAVQIVVAVAVVAGVFLYLLPKIANYSEVWRVVSRLTGTQLALLVGATAFNIFTYWPQMVAAMPGLTLAQAAVNNQASTAIANTLPGGGALAVGVAYTMFREWGFDNAAIGLMALLTGIWNSFVKFGMPVVALAVLAIQGDVTKGLAIGSLIGLAALVVSIAVLVLMLWKESLARAIGERAGRIVSSLRRLLRRRPVTGWADAAADFRDRTIDLVRRRWHWLTLTTVVSHVGLYLVLLISLRAVGVTAGQVTWAEALGVFAFARLVSALPITPGGAGVIELTYIAGMVLAGGPKAEVVAAVLIFRALTWGLQIPLGPLAYAVYGFRRSWRTGSKRASTASRSGTSGRAARRRRSERDSVAA
jgi:putative heme transporter